MPAELQAIHRYVTETPVLEAVTEEIRAVVETVWPELISKFSHVKALRIAPQAPPDRPRLRDR